MATTAVLRLDGVAHTYQAPRGGTVEALVAVDLTVERGEFVTLRGPSGSGKTTLLSIAGGMLHPSQGRVWLGSTDLYAGTSADRDRCRARHVGFVFQMFHLLPYLDVLDNVRVGGGPQPIDPARARKALEELGLGHRLGHRPRELSTGERQRVALARALIAEPQLVLADEPTGNLDAAAAQAVLDGLARYTANGGAVLLVTHGDRPVTAATRGLRLEGGRVVATVEG